MYILYSQVKALGPTWTHHASTSTAPGCLCAYDARQGSLLHIWPRSGEAEAFQLTLASPGPVKLQSWHGKLLIYTEGGQESSLQGEKLVFFLGVAGNLETWC